MKKVLFTIGIIAILAWVAFASMAAASNPSLPWNSLEQKIDALSTKVTNLQVMYQQSGATWLRYQ